VGSHQLPGAKETWLHPGVWPEDGIQPTWEALSERGALVCKGRPSPVLACPRASPHLSMETIKGHDGPKEEEGQVEVVLEKIS
jgi:hypothetical protein